MSRADFDTPSLVALGLQEPAAHAGQALHQQRFNARILDH